VVFAGLQPCIFSGAANELLAEPGLDRHSTMMDETYNPGDPLFLVSRDLDADLSKEERDRLTEVLRSSESLRAEANRLRAVDRMVRQWGFEGVEIDWKHHAGLVAVTLRTDSDDGVLYRVDELIAAWARRRPVFDERAFTQGVLDRIKPSGRKSRVLPWALRLGAPLAAAAAIALAVTATIWFVPTPLPVAVVSIGHADNQKPPSRPVEPKVIVSFARPATDRHTVATAAPGIGYMTIGSSPLPRAWDEPAPL
jgi:hypothetical protein